MVHEQDALAALAAVVTTRRLWKPTLWTRLEMLNGGDSTLLDLKVQASWIHEQQRKSSPFCQYEETKYGDYPRNPEEARQNRSMRQSGHDGKARYGHKQPQNDKIYYSEAG
jgi:hypothetical protein